jgi:hypothetical protein
VVQYVYRRSGDKSERRQGTRRGRRVSCEEGLGVVGHQATTRRREWKEWIYERCGGVGDKWTLRVEAQVARGKEISRARAQDSVLWSSCIQAESASSVTDGHA